MAKVIVRNNPPSVVIKFSYKSYWCPKCEDCIATDFGWVAPIPNCPRCKVKLQWSKEMLDKNLQVAKM
jgi:hypothetical protein